MTSLSTLTPADVKTLALPSEITKVLYQVMNIFHRKARQRNLPYWAIGGTQLGTTRHGGIIPWDDDLDVAIFEEDSDLVTQILDEIYTENHGLYDYSVHDFRSSSRGWKVFTADKPFPALLDIFIWEKVVVDGVQLARVKNYRPARPTIFPANDVLRVKDLYDTKGKIPERRFGDIMINSIANPIPYLNVKYPNWSTVVHVFNHTTHCKGKSKPMFRYAVGAFASERELKAKKAAAAKKARLARVARVTKTLLALKKKVQNKKSSE